MSTHARSASKKTQSPTLFVEEAEDMPTAALMDLFSRSTSILIEVAGSVFTLVMVYGGIRLMVAHNPRAVQGAKELLGRAAIGLILILMVDALKTLLQYIAS